MAAKRPASGRSAYYAWSPAGQSRQHRRQPPPAVAVPRPSHPQPDGAHVSGLASLLRYFKQLSQAALIASQHLPQVSRRHRDRLVARGQQLAGSHNARVTGCASVKRIEPRGRPRSPLLPGGSPRRRSGPRKRCPARAAGGTCRKPRGRTCKSWRPSSSRQSCCRRAKITVKCARCGYVPPMALRATPDCDLRAARSRAYQEDGEGAGLPPGQSGLSVVPLTHAMN